MSITVMKDKGLTVVTVTADRSSVLPPLCQIIKTLCCGFCCSVYKGLMHSDATAALGTIQIMVGLFNIGLGPGRPPMYHRDLSSMGAAYWLGGVFIITGIVNLVDHRCSSLCSVRFVVCVNIVGSLFAFVGIVLYSKDLADVPATGMCAGESHDPNKNYYINNNDYVYYYLQLRAMDITLIIMAVLQLCVCIRFAAVSIKAVVNRKKEERNAGEDEQPQLKKVVLISPVDKNQFS